MNTIEVEAQIKLISDYASVEETVNLVLPQVDGYALMPTRGALSLRFKNERTLAFCLANIQAPYIRMEIRSGTTFLSMFIWIDSVVDSAVNILIADHTGKLERS